MLSRSPYFVSLVFGLCWMQGTLAQFHHLSLVSSFQRQLVRLLML